MRDIGYMECIMDWHLIYRDEKQMLDLVATIEERNIGSIRTFKDPLSNIVFLDVVRANV